MIEICLKQLQTPLGTMVAGATAQGIIFIEFVSGKNPPAQLERLGKELDAVITAGENGHLLKLEQELQEYFNKRRTVFTVPLHLAGTDFQKAVWHSLMEIPYGKTFTYKQQAVKLGKLPAIRAVAASNGQNRHAIVIPCHRVIGSNGKLTGYAGGLEKKAWLLDFETDKAKQAPELPFE